jgi:hypothetical protein
LSSIFRSQGSNFRGISWMKEKPRTSRVKGVTPKVQVQGVKKMANL